MNRWLDCIQICYGCSLGISDDLINFWDESIKKAVGYSDHQRRAESQKFSSYSKINCWIFLFSTDMTYVPEQFIPYIFFGTKP